MSDPLQEPFIGILKLVTGEELISFVCESEEEGVLMLQNPMIVVEATELDDFSMIKGFKLDLWMKAAMDQDEIFFIQPDKVLTMTEANESIGNFYQENIPHIFRNNVTNRTKPTNDMGHVGNIEQARFLFEKLYRS